MVLPRGRRWQDRPRAAKPTAAARVQAVLDALHSDTAAIPDPIAYRDQLHREVEARRQRQGQLPLARD
ncbi:hypothetical protein WCE55_02275 [Luteimonas sp. MJ293]|uniref:hypothetical protein n=1 Tax=Luteimonas sp. MJ146 TaxID=3129240 RepID=UPI0031B9C217